MLAEVRKYRMGLILSTQYCSQLGNLDGRGGDDLLSAVFGNVGTLISFRTGSQDAEELGKGLAPYFSPLDITALPNYHGYARMNLGTEVMPPFSFRTEFDPTPGDDQVADYIRSYSRDRYGRPADQVEKDIGRHTRYLDVEEESGELFAANQPEDCETDVKRED
jgi:hypothetical protein